MSNDKLGLTNKVYKLNPAIPKLDRGIRDVGYVLKTPHMRRQEQLEKQATKIIEKSEPHIVEHEPTIKRGRGIMRGVKVRYKKHGDVNELLSQEKLRLRKEREVKKPEYQHLKD